MSPWAPGTIGTLGAIPLLWAMQRLGEMQYLYVTIGVAIAAIVVASVYEIEVATSHDQKEIVIDEVAGFLVTMAWVPFSVTWVVIGFVLFRFFDALKPFPISWLDRRIEGGVGVVADDLAAGVISNIILQYLFTHHLWGLA